MGFSRDLRKKVFEKVESFSLTEINEVGTASLITRTTNDINQVQMVVIMMMRMMLSAPLMIVGALIMALRKDVELSKVILVGYSNYHRYDCYYRQVYATNVPKDAK